MNYEASIQYCEEGLEWPQGALYITCLSFSTFRHIVTISRAIGLLLRIRKI